MNREKEAQSGRKTDKELGRQTYSTRQTKRQTDRWTESQTWAVKHRQTVDRKR